MMGGLSGWARRDGFELEGLMTRRRATAQGRRVGRGGCGFRLSRSILCNLVVSVAWLVIRSIGGENVRGARQERLSAFQRPLLTY